MNILSHGTCRDDVPGGDFSSLPSRNASMSLWKSNGKSLTFHPSFPQSFLYHPPKKMSKKTHNIQKQSKTTISHKSHTKPPSATTPKKPSKTTFCACSKTSMAWCKCAWSAPRSAFNDTKWVDGWGQMRPSCFRVEISWDCCLLELDVSFKDEQMSATWGDILRAGNNQREWLFVALTPMSINLVSQCEITPL